MTKRTRAKERHFRLQQNDLGRRGTPDLARLSQRRCDRFCFVDGLGNRGALKGHRYRQRAHLVFVAVAESKSFNERLVSLNPRINQAARWYATRS